jgi:hypothetical protein
MNTHEQIAGNDKTATVKAKRKLTPRPTVKQRRIAQLIVDSAHGKRPDIKTTGDLVVQAGYAATVKEVPHKILDTSGVHIALEELGFNPETAKEVVKTIMLDVNAKHADRLKASEMVFKVHGSFAADKHVNVNVNADVDTQALTELATRLREQAR